MEQQLIHDGVSDAIVAAAEKLAKQQSEKITVRDILKEMGITNRVFYNRFRNIDEVLDILYREMVRKVRESLAVEWNDDSDFFGYVTAIASQTLIISYENKEKLNRYIFETDSARNENMKWWMGEIRRIICKGIETGKLKQDIDADVLGYNVWCFIRGFNADALERGLSKEDALEKFRYGLGVFLNGVSAR